MAIELVQTPSSIEADAKLRFADVLIESAAIEFAKDSLGMQLIIGKGAFGHVVLARYAEHNVAVKVLWHHNEREQTAFLKEARILKACRSPYIVLLLGVVFWEGFGGGFGQDELLCSVDSRSVPGSSDSASIQHRGSGVPSLPVERAKMMMVMEFLPRRDLFCQLHESPDPTECMWHKRGRRIAGHIARGLVYLHSNNIAHMDLKSQNVLLTESYQAKLADVGLAKFMRQDASDQKMSTISGFTWQYSAPEVLEGDRSLISEKADIFSLGVVIWEICTGESPHAEVPFYVYMANKSSFSLRSIRVPEEGPQELSDLLLDCLSSDPSRRPTASQALQRLIAAPRNPKQSPNEGLM